MLRFFGRIRRDQNGVTAVEYALLEALIAIGIGAAATAYADGPSLRQHRRGSERGQRRQLIAAALA